MEGDTVFVVVVIVVVYGQAGGGIRRWRSEEIIEQNLIVLKIREMTTENVMVLANKLEVGQQ